MKKLTVCLANDSFPPTIDGVANAVVNYATVINNQLGKSIVVTPYYPNVTDNYDFPVVRYQSLDLSKITGYRAGNPFDIEVLTQLNKYNIDIIHTHCPIASAIMARTLQQSIHKPIVLTYHSRFDLEIQSMVKSHLIQDEAINILVNNIESLDEVWTVSKGAGESLKAMGFKGDYIVMPNGVDIEKGKSTKAEIDAFKKQHNIDPSLPVYLYVGRMRWNKGLKVILDALRDVKSSGLDYRMMFVGDGLDLDAVKKYAKEIDAADKCLFFGSIYDRNELKIIYSSSDIFLFPSEIDTNGIVVREAAATECGTILLKDTCAAEDTIDKKNVIQIGHSYQALAKELISAGYNMDYFHQIGKNASQDLYLSWEYAVKNAYERYGIVIDKYQYNKPEFNVLDIADNTIKTFSDLSLLINRIEQQALENKVRKLQERENISNAIETIIGNAADRINEADLKANKIRQRNIENLQNATESVKERAQKIREDIVDVFERYL